MGNALGRLGGKQLVDGGVDKESSRISTVLNYNQKAVSELIKKRRLAPFYPDDPQKIVKNVEKRRLLTFKRRRKERSQLCKEWFTTELVDCPICFNSYPRNINKTCCCDQPICTRCFVNLRMQRNNKVSCPYCKQIALGVIYDPPTLILKREDTQEQVKQTESKELNSDDLGVTSQSSPEDLYFYNVRQSIQGNPTQVTSNRQRYSNYLAHNPYRPTPMSSSNGQAEHPSNRSYYHYYSLHPFL
jgi:hypothetical protein